MTDQQLISGILNRDRAAVQFLVGKYHRQVIRTAFHFVNDMNDAEDIAQDVCLEVLESCRNFRGTSSLSTWIYRITVNKSLNFNRKNKRKERLKQFESIFMHPDSGSGTPDPEPHTESQALDDKERKFILDKALNSLPESQRTAFILSKYEELSYRDIAGIMNTSLASVESLIQRARQNLQKRLIHQFSEYAKRK